MTESKQEVTVTVVVTPVEDDKKTKEESRESKPKLLTEDMPKDWER